MIIVRIVKPLRFSIRPEDSSKECAHGRLRGDNIDDGIPECLKGEDQGGDIIERKVDHGRLDEAVQTIDAGWYPCD